MTPDTLLAKIDAGNPFIQFSGRSHDDLTPDGQSLITEQERLRQNLLLRVKVLIVVSLSGGISCNLEGFSPEEQRAINQILRRHNLNGASFADTISAIIDLAKEQHEFGFVIIIRNGERCFPRAENGFLSEEQHTLYERIAKLGSTLAILKTKNAVIIEAEPGTIDPAIEKAATPVVRLYADEEEITGVIETTLARYPDARLENALTVEHAARLLSHTPTFDVVTMIRGSHLTGEPITTAQLKRQKQEIVQKQTEGVLTYLSAREDVELVGQYLEPVMQELQAIFTLLTQGHKDTPLFVVLSGPPGIGKTVLVTKLAQEAGIPVFELQSMMSKWQGEAQRLSKKMHDTRREQGPNVVIADEGRNISTQRDSEHDNGTSAELNRDWLSAFSDGTMRGRSIIVATMNVPNLLQTAMKTKAEFIPVFAPSLSDLHVIIAHLCTKYEFNLDDSEVAEAASILHSKMASPRDIENMLRRLRRHQAIADQVLPAADDLLIPESQAQATMLCDYWNLQIMNGRSALPWRDRQTMPAHIAAVIDDNDKIKFDLVRQRIEGLSHVRV